MSIIYSIKNYSVLTLKCSSSTLFFIMSSREIAPNCGEGTLSEAGDPTRDPRLELRAEERGRERYV